VQVMGGVSTGCASIERVGVLEMGIMMPETC